MDACFIFDDVRDIASDDETSFTLPLFSLKLIYQYEIPFISCFGFSSPYLYCLELMNFVLQFLYNNRVISFPEKQVPFLP